MIIGRVILRYRRGQKEMRPSFASLKRRLSILLAAGILAGVGAAYITTPVPSKMEAISASTSCTRYVPNTSPGVLCGQITYNPVGFDYHGQTSSFAYRDDNYAEWNTTQDWALYYVNWNTGASFDKVTGTGTSASEGGSQGIYAAAACVFYNDPVANYNDCTTDWH